MSFNLSEEIDEFRYAKGSVLWAGAIAAAIYFGQGSVSAEAQGGIHKIAICDADSGKCVAVSGSGYFRNALQVYNRVFKR